MRPRVPTSVSVALGALLFLNGCAPAAPAPATTPESDLSGLGYKHWAQLIEERTGGRIKFQFFWAGSLLTSQQQFQGLRDGLADFGGASMGALSGPGPAAAAV